MQLWDLEDILQGSGSTAKGSLAAADSDADSDDMDVDTSAPKSKRGILQTYVLISCLLL